MCVCVCMVCTTVQSILFCLSLAELLIDANNMYKNI